MVRLLVYFGYIGLIIGIIVLVKGDLKFLGIKTRNVGVVVLIVSLLISITGIVRSRTWGRALLKNNNIQLSHYIDSVEETRTSEKTRRDVVLNLLREGLDGIANVELDKQSKIFKITSVDTDFITGLVLMVSDIDNDKVSKEDWDKLVEVVVDYSRMLSENGLPGYKVYFMNPLNTERKLLKVMDGVVLYNFSE